MPQKPFGNGGCTDCRCLALLPTGNNRAWTVEQLHRNDTNGCRCSCRSTVMLNHEAMRIQLALQATGVLQCLA